MLLIRFYVMSPNSFLQADQPLYLSWQRKFSSTVRSCYFSCFCSPQIWQLTILHTFLTTKLNKDPTVSSHNADLFTQNQLSIIGQICPDKGLEKQNNQCHGCGAAIGMNYGNSRLCHFDGYNYCFDCHENEEYFIPAKIIHHWDFSKYPVAKCTKRFLHNIKDKPLINMEILNPQIYTVRDSMAHLQVLRSQLGFLWSFVVPCKGSVSEELQMRLWPRDYLYKNVHLYSLIDLVQASNGILAETLESAIFLAKRHVLNCGLCTVKGFLCEVCDSLDIIYPFEVGSTYRCEKCQTIYHSICMNADKTCCKCEQKQEVTSD